ncbi:MAG: cytochrome c biogenesis protein CcsA [Saprospiraceae bacterium]|nr:cytochrome c biogenesis protein [Saprospiraceae bacterium]MDW8230554.1 cytochrome c biogenesis protein CcsA [Saprospiraceae bacterium]
MWWKITSVILLLYAILAGFLVPLKSGIERVEPNVAQTGQRLSVRFFGYNTFFSRPSQEPIRVWLYYNDRYALMAQDVRPLNDTILEATFQMPANLPDGRSFVTLNALADHPAAGASLLPVALTLRQVDTTRAPLDSAWTAHPVEKLHLQKGFSFPYQNILYETIRNTYFHVPMWFVLLFLFAASVWYSVKYLRRPEADFDRRAAAYAEVGILFGLLGLASGMVWANYTWGKPWSNDIKQLMTAVALLVYFAYFILRGSFSDPEKGARLAAVYNIFAFASLIPLLYILPRMFDSLHPGATGNPAFGTQDLDNTMRAVFYPAILGWTLLGFWIADLRVRLQRLKDRAMGLD